MRTGFNQMEVVMGVRQRRELKLQLERMQERYDSFPDFAILPPRAKYVGLKNDGEVELEECDYNDEDVRE